jgi:hypothetical protein
MFDLLADLWGLMRERRKFWLAPLVIVLLLVGAMVLLSEFSAIAPFIYTVF